MDNNLEAWIAPLLDTARRAGDAILEVYSTDFEVQAKDDQSPLTKADLASHAVIDAALRELTPDLPIISEESGLPEFSERSTWTRYWLIDPLDGTKEFVNRNGEFTVNIALIDDHRPVLGIVHVPVAGVSYTGCAGSGSQRWQTGTAETITVTPQSPSVIRVVGSRSHRGSSLDGFLARIGDHEMLAMGSSLKFCRIAEGEADIYPRLGPTSEWDTAAAQAVVEQAGGKVLELDGKPLSYNRKEDILNPYFVVIGPSDRDWLNSLAD